jgi:hypothetical protein
MYINYYSLEKFLLLLFLIVLFLRVMFTPKNSPNQGPCCSLTKYFIFVIHKLVVTSQEIFHFTVTSDVKLILNFDLNK